MFQAIQSYDLAALWWMRSFQSPYLVWAAWLVATIAWKGWLWWGMIIGSWWRGNRQFGAHLGAALILSTVAGLPLKGLIARPRPDLYASQQLNIPMPELMTTAHSFPSGHTLLAAAFAFVVVSHFKDMRAWLAFAFVIAVGMARVYQGLHWPSDIAGSIMLGAVCALVAGRLIQTPLAVRWINRPAKTVPAQEEPPVAPVVSTAGGAGYKG